MLDNLDVLVENADGWTCSGDKGNTGIAYGTDLPARFQGSARDGFDLKTGYQVLLRMSPALSVLGGSGGCIHMVSRSGL